MEIPPIAAAGTATEIRPTAAAGTATEIRPTAAAETAIHREIITVEIPHRAITAIIISAWKNT